MEAETQDQQAELHQARLEAAHASGGISSNAAIYRRFLEVIDEFQLGGSVLDYGAGVGNFTRELVGSGRFTSVAAVDILPRPEALPDGVTWHTRDLNEPFEVNEPFDVIVSPEVIEHLENPRQVAREWRRLLRSGGTLLCSTPNNESIRSLLALVMRGHYVAFDDACYPAHITALLRKDFTRILDEVGFSPPEFRFVHTGGIPKLPWLTWQGISFGMLRGLRFSDNILVLARAK